MKKSLFIVSLIACGICASSCGKNAQQNAEEAVEETVPQVIVTATTGQNAQVSLTYEKATESGLYVCKETGHVLKTDLSADRMTEAPDTVNLNSEDSAYAIPKTHCSDEKLYQFLYEIAEDAFADTNVKGLTITFGKGKVTTSSTITE